MTDANGVTRHLAVGAGKDQAIYLVDRDNMGKFNPQADNIYQEFLSALPAGIYSTPAYFNGRLYYGPVNNNLLSFQFSSRQAPDPSHIIDQHHLCLSRSNPQHLREWRQQCHCLGD